ncbi:MAG TPA: ABC transporter ATP-binding protein [Kofleriaceae bacterium]|nr:ABC transporter ATP-binding protein [Kofleriaceae bacterium]
MIQVSNLTKYYGGKRALGPVSFEIDKGETVGFLGLNGAGKTTALRILACDLRPSAGTVSVGGVDALSDPHQVRKRIGFLPETPPVYQDMSVQAFLEFAADLRGVGRGERARLVGEAVEVTDLGGVVDDPIITLSHGYRQRVGVAQAVVHKPALVILDEPTRGLDPKQIVEMRKLIHGLKDRHTVLISSHILSEVSQTCDRLLVLGEGRILGAGTESELAAHEGNVKNVSITVRVPAGKGEPYRDGDGDPKATITSILRRLDGVTDVAEPQARGDGWAVAISCTKDLRGDISRAVVQAGLDLLKLDYARSELENTFLSLVDTGATPAAA